MFDSIYLKNSTPNSLLPGILQTKYYKLLSSEKVADKSDNHVLYHIAAAWYQRRIMRCIFGRDFLSLIDRWRARLNCCRVSWLGKTVLRSVTQTLREKLRVYPKFTRFNFTKFLGTSIHGIIGSKYFKYVIFS